MKYENPELIESIKQNEGFRSKPYKCSEGYQTIGYGRNLETNGVNEFEALIMLTNDLKLIDWRLRKDINLASHPKFVQDILMEMAYQLGVNGLLKFEKTLQYVENKDYESASKEMLDSIWAKQTPQRAKMLSELMACPF